MATKARRHEEERLVGTALTLWLVLAFLVWNVVFDRVLVVAGRQFVDAASVAESQGGPYLQISDWMSRAAAHGLRVASLSAAGVLVVAWVAVPLGHRRASPRAASRP